MAVLLVMASDPLSICEVCFLQKYPCLILLHISLISIYIYVMILCPCHTSPGVVPVSSLSVDPVCVCEWSIQLPDVD